jgi:predicted NAD/FAD-dependent oxidoreductase
MAAVVVERLQASALVEEFQDPATAQVIAGFVGQLRGLAATKTSRFSLMAAYDSPLEEVPFDAAACHNSPLHFVSRESTKPGRINEPREHWVAVSSPGLAAAIDKELEGVDPESPEFRFHATTRMGDAWEELIGCYYSTKAKPVAAHTQARRWGNAFYEAPLMLNAVGKRHNDAVTFQQWGLALCGDYLGSRQDVQQAALSGMMAANRIAMWNQAIERGGAA